jgi:diadenosine tetraphosphate (Ap4A) HIT family hydrolase
MAGNSPEWKVYRDGDYVAGCKYPADAAVLVGLAGGQVRFGHSLVVWNEGKEAFSAFHSSTRAADVMQERRVAKISKSYDRAYGEGAAARLLGRV